MNIPTIEWCKEHKLGLTSCKVLYPEFYELLQNKYPDLKISEQLYNYFYGRPACKVCGKSTKYINFIKGYGEYCCRACMHKSEEVKEKIKQTTLEHYGVTSPIQSKEIKEKIARTNIERYGSENPFGSPLIQERIKQTNLERYGVAVPIQSEAIKEKITRTNIERYGSEVFLQSIHAKELSKQTNIERYGSENPFGSPLIQERIKQTNLEKYGVEYPMQSKEILDKAVQTNLERYGVPCSAQAEVVKERTVQTNLEKYGVEYPMQSKEIQEKAVQICTDKYGVPYGFLNTEPGYSKSSQEYFKSLDEQYPNAIYATKGGEQRVGPYLLDWYDPDSNTVIEFNGDYWHANPKLYSEDWIHPIKKCTARELWEHDREKKEYLEALGYKVKVMWESDYIK